MNTLVRNSYTLKEILKMCEALNVHADENVVFDYIRIVNLDKQVESEAKSVLFFPIYFTNYDVEDGWVINPLDLRPKIAEIMENNPNYVFVVEEDMLSLFDNDKYQYIVVKDILKSITNIYDYVLNKVNPKVVAVTGSVGKTTSVGLIEKVLAKKYKTLRVYHKRITPILLKAHIINFLTEDIEYVALEMSIYYRDHVKVLSNLIEPDIACFLQQDSSHLHKDGMDTVEELACGKAEIFRNASVGLYNGRDSYINRLSFKDNKLYYDGNELFETNLKEFKSFVSDVVYEKDGFVIQGNFVKPYLLTEMSTIQYSQAFEVGISADISEDKIVEALNEYVPVENRVIKGEVFGKEVFFDGDVTTYERMKQISKNKYESSILVIRKFGSAENVDRFDQVLEYFDKFSKVYVFDDIEYLTILTKHDNVCVVNNHDFMKNYDGTIFYHYSGYFRDYDIIDDNNLLDLSNDTYKIIPYKEG